MTFKLGFQTKHILKPWCIIFYSAKVPLKVFSILFKVNWAHCGKIQSWNKLQNLNYIIFNPDFKHSQAAYWPKNWYITPELNGPHRLLILFFLKMPKFFVSKVFILGLKGGWTRASLKPQAYPMVDTKLQQIIACILLKFQHSVFFLWGPPFKTSIHCKIHRVFCYGKFYNIFLDI